MVTLRLNIVEYYTKIVCILLVPKYKRNAVSDGDTTHLMCQPWDLIKMLKRDVITIARWNYYVIGVTGERIGSYLGIINVNNATYQIYY